MMLLRSLSAFCEKNSQYNKRFEAFLKLQELNSTQENVVLGILCELLMDPKCTEAVAQCFAPFLIAILSMSILGNGMKETCFIENDIVHKLNCVILGKLISINQDVIGFAFYYFDLNPSPFETICNTISTQAKKRKTDLCHTAEVSDYDVITATYSILKAATNHFRHKWNWSKLYKYLNNNDERIQWVALKCIGVILDMSESRLLTCAQSLNINFNRFLSQMEEKSLTISNTPEDIQFQDNLVSNIPYVASIANILVPIFQRNNSKDMSKLVSVPSMQENLQSLAIAVSSRKCICLQGVVGSGKTALVEYLARVTGHDTSNFIKVQLGDQTDSKMLLGMYRCTDIPGEFVWQPGVLTQAVMNGKWLLLEDIDSAALDVASVLNNLLETGTLSVPGYRDVIYANSGFQLFVTQRLITSSTGVQKVTSGASNLLQKHWLCINVEPLSKNELVTVIKTLFPALSTVATRIVDVFLLFSMGHCGIETNSVENLILKNGRQTSTRDLIKWCSRAIIDFNVASPDSGLKIFQDAIDVFCCSVPDQDQRLSLAIEVAHKLGIVKTKAEYFCNIYKPSVTLLPDVFVGGRAKLPRKKSEFATIDFTKMKFSFTRPSACLLERITSCVMQKEPVLLVGETGTGKTSSVQYLAHSTGHKLIVINMNQQSESADLLGGYKPVDFKFLISPIREEFDILFRSYFMIQPNAKFLEHLALCYKQQKWKVLVKLMNHSTMAAVKRLRTQVEQDKQNKQLLDERSTIESSKRGDDKTNTMNSREIFRMLRKWEKMAEKLNKLMLQVKTQYSIAFSFIEGSLIKALQEGHWVLLDEINLASAETLECLSGLLEGSSGSLSLLERGDKEFIKRHENFTMFACMNPATDVGKKELPVGLRNRFTEFYVDELTEPSDLLLLVSSYLKDLNLPTAKLEAIVKFYLNVRKEAKNTLFDGTAHKPHYSLRTLCRALSISASNACGIVSRSLYEAFALSFLTQLDCNSYPIVERMIAKAILDAKTMKAILGSPIPKPKCAVNEEYICFEGYWLIRGTLTPKLQNNYILTESVRRNLKDLVRVVSIGKMPVLLQGGTSVGKTSLITYLSKASGHVCVRINNHEHTDLQEYVGSYVADETGKLMFKEGILVEAMRKGHWIILDELNLAPSDVLEALNRVLDDNRELFIPETQQVVKAHEHFMLFATQNPPGLYGGRKVLSRAFRNRFVELHFDEIPPQELQIILHERCSMPESYCKQIINVMTDLQIRRKSTAAFAGKQGFITLRDLFRWGERYRLAPDVGERLYDWSQHLADEGYLVLAAKVRKTEEAQEIRQVIKKHLKRDVDANTLFTLNEKTSPVTRHALEKILKNTIPEFKHIVWTYHMRRMAVLVLKSCQFKEPVLLVGETGCGKTTVCQLIASMNKQTMLGVNCHMHTESSDFLGNLRPVREHHNTQHQKLFEWVDGPLISAMRNGDLFLADEISLADDSVLERLNSLLEPERSLLLAEKGIESTSNEESECIITAAEAFIFVGTMNPGGDYGKKELSPALRNRFTEIWCEGCTEDADLRDIIEHNLHENMKPLKSSVSTAILQFLAWLPTTEVGKKFTISIRDILTWVNFINTCIRDESLSALRIGDAYFHGACLTYIDSLGSGSTCTESDGKLKDFKDAAINYIKKQTMDLLKSQLTVDEAIGSNTDQISMSTDVFGVSPFYIAKGSNNFTGDTRFNFTTPTTKLNTLKLLRGLQLTKPILLEGSPGVGKTSLVSALAKASSHSLLRINLSDQTDVSDLFGADLPVEGGRSGEFAWKDGPFLRALRAGHWILLDELNLASQSVLEGLNACFDHRGKVYIPELGKTFDVKPGTKLFACQNPLKQGGARRGLPKSFLNRFTQVFVDILTDDDLNFILETLFPQLPTDLIRDMVRFNARLSAEAGTSWGFRGSPWEMNLRDMTRWCEAIIQSMDCQSASDNIHYNPGIVVELIYVDRMRTQEDKQIVRRIYEEIFCLEKYPFPPSRLVPYVTATDLYVGDVKLHRADEATYDNCNLLLLRDQIPILRSLIQCVNMNWMSILVGGSGCGKSSVVRLLASLVGQKLKSIVVNSAMDTTEILGGFEQTDYNRHLERLLERVEGLLIDSLKRKLSLTNLKLVEEHHAMLEKVRRLSDDEPEDTRTMAAEVEFFLRKTSALAELVTAMKLFEPSYESELLEIEANLQELTNFVRQDRCLNAGGKFEWVDSVLVKCLQDGKWLLIDQVNLCSPAVLDRLNGLLEPNGVLTIGERGVDNRGNIVTIKPHKNFRLFLTMDPKYGEISRAMRNRGVEIYMLGQKENIDFDSIDLRSMMGNSGIVKRLHQDILLDIYRRLSKEILTVDKITVVELMHSAFLLKQRLSRGFPVKKAMRNAAIDVYVKARSVRDPRIKEQLIGVIDEAINEIRVDENGENYVSPDALTWSVKNLLDNSRLTILSQQGLLLCSAIKLHQSCLKSESISSTTAFFNHFLDLSTDDQRICDFEVSQILRHFLLDFYERSTREDVQLRSEWLEKLLTGEPVFEEIKKIHWLVAKEILRFPFQDTKKAIPWDPRRLPGISDNRFNVTLNDADRLALVLYLNTMINKDENLLNDLVTEKVGKLMTVKQYSNAVYNDKIECRLKNQPLIRSFVIFLTKVMECIDLLFRDGNFIVSPTTYAEFRKNLKWCNRFSALGDTILINKLEKSKDIYVNLNETSLLLRVHYKWLVKFLSSVIQVYRRHSLEEKTMAGMESLLTTIDDINGNLSTIHDPFRKISRRLKKYLDLPLPHSSEASMKLSTKLIKMSKEFSPLDHSTIENTLRWELKILSLQFNEALAMRQNLISTCVHIYQAKEMDDDKTKMVEQIENFCRENNLSLRTSVEMTAVLDKIKCIPAKEMAEMSSKIQLWPIYEYMFLKYSKVLQRNALGKGNEISSNVTAMALTKFANIPTIPANLIALLNTITMNDVEQCQKLLLLPELFIGLVQFSENSYAAKDSKFLLHWRGITEEDIERSVTSGQMGATSRCTIDGLVLLHLILELVLNQSKNNKDKSILAMATLGTHNTRVNQLKTLNNMLWRNAVPLTSNEISYRSNDLCTLKAHLQILISAIDKMEADHDVGELMTLAIAKQGKYEKAELEAKFQRDFVEPMLELRQLRSRLDTIEDFQESELERGKSWTLLGYLETTFFGNLGYIDPVHKVKIKLKHIEEDIEDLKKALYVEALQCKILGTSMDMAEQHPRYLEMEKLLQNLIKEKSNLERMKAVRPSSLEYGILSGEAGHFLSAIATHETIHRHVENLQTTAMGVRENTTISVIKPAEDAVREAEMWLLSVQRFFERMESKYLSGYPDVVLPLMLGLAHLKHGIRTLVDETRRLTNLAQTNTDKSFVRSLLLNLISFPTINMEQGNLLNLVDFCICQDTREFISRNLHSENPFVVLQEQFNMVKCGLHELFNYIVVNGILSKSTWKTLNILLQQVALIWKKQESEAERRKAEEDSLYKNKAETLGSSLSEEEEINLELRNLFPTYREQDFVDIENFYGNSLEQNPNKKTADLPDKYEGLITDDDLSEIEQIHSTIVRSFVVSSWLNSDEKQTKITHPNYIEPLIQRFNTIGSLLETITSHLNENLTSKIYSSVNFLTAVALRKSRGEYTHFSAKSSKKTYDYYRDSNIEEVKQCIPITDGILNRINQLLLEWPDYPTLKSIRAIIERIYGFPITSPLSRFLTGLELLLVKMHEWEENAHSGVSLSEFTTALVQQIISWRKLELACWKDCLNSAYERLRSKASKWWFYLYALIESFILKSKENEQINENETITKEKFVESLELFMNQSSIVEFEYRLDLIMAFHCHVQYFEASTEKDEVSAILWNVYNYYKQFTGDVKARIDTVKMPIEKKLKDFVKIARWNDISYWAVKETVEKTHRTLHKYIKEFETALKQNVSASLKVKPESYNAEMSKGIWDNQNQEEFSINPSDFIIGKSVQNVNKNVLVKGALVSRSDILLTKAKRLCKEAILMSSYPCIRGEIENFVMDFMEESTKLKHMEIDRNLPKNKQKSQAKSILQQKRMALANYFKALTSLGISYRVGILSLKNNTDNVIDFTVTPLNLSAATQFFPTKKTDEQMLAQWSGCDKYYYKSLVKLNALKAVLTSAKTDLGQQNMERCKGFSTHLIILAHKQKRLLAESFKDFVSLRCQVANLSYLENNELHLPRMSDLRKNAEALKDLLISLQMEYEQLQLYFTNCANEPELEVDNDILVLTANNLPILNVNKDDEIWTKVNELLKDCLTTVKTILKRFNSTFVILKLTSVDDDECQTRNMILTSKHYKFLEDSFNTVEKLKSQMNDLKDMFRSANACHPIVENIRLVEEKIDYCASNFKKIKSSLENDQNTTDNENIVQRYEETLEQLLNSILLVIQKKFKDHNTLMDDNSLEKENVVSEVDEDKKNDDQFSENELKEKLVDSLEKDIKDLMLKKIVQQFEELSNIAYKLDDRDTIYCNRLLLRCAPLLEQYTLFAQFYLNEQVASFRVTCKLLYLQLNVFLDLAVNGFCVPKDLDVEEGEGEESQENVQGGMGLGDGDGQKDVSERIETEDQLEDARPADEEREKQDDKDCKEEEKGIDMSEDFDSKLQDLEKTEENGDKSDDDDKDDDIDKEMGETENTADQLDQEIWGDNEEEIEEEEQLNDKEEQSGKGEETGEKEMGAKDDKTNKDEDDNDDRQGEEQEKEQKKDINELNEPETNDDQIDPYHGKHQPEPEPEPLDLPDDLNLDDEEAKDDHNGDEENPFDIDEMKESQLPPEKDEAEDKMEEDKDKSQENDDNKDSSDEEEVETDPNVNAEKDQIKDEDLNAEEGEKEAPGQPTEQEKQKEEGEEMEEDRKAEEKAAPSMDNGSKESDAAEEVNSTDGSRDKVAQQAEADNKESSAENSQEDDKNKGVGQSFSEQQDSGHSGSSTQASAPISQENAAKQMEKRKKPGKSDENRSLLDKVEPDKKKMRMIDTREEMADDGSDKDDNNREEEAEMCAHIKNSEKFDDYTMDAATEDQAKQQTLNTEEKETKEKDDVMDVEMHQDEEDEQMAEDESPKKQNPEKIEKSEKEQSKKDPTRKGDNVDDSRMETVDVEGEIIETNKIERGYETDFFTNLKDNEDLSGSDDAERKRFEVEKMLSQWSCAPSTEEAMAAWNCLSVVTDSAARDLSEKLRLVLEPTQASRLKGDYRTGRRINMRKIIPYIASQFRKDKIWLRRTKPSKRDYQIVLALDDSSSMADNHSKELAFESLSLISKAMTYLEVGQLCVMSFGEQITVLHPLGETFTEQSGSRLIQDMRFDQKKTMVGQLVDFTVDMFEHQSCSMDNAKLLVVLSDGRGIFSEGTDKVNRAVRRARLADIFLVFIIVDNPINKDSILDIRMPVFKDGKLLGIRSYMDNFPFPFYMILRDINMLPDVLSDALRQWFEVVGKIDS